MFPKVRHEADSLPAQERTIRLAIFMTLLVASATHAGGFKDSSTNTVDSVQPGSVSKLQWESCLWYSPWRQWAEKVIGSPMERAPGSTEPPEAGFRLQFTVKVPKNWKTVPGDITKIHTLHPSLTGPNYYRIYIVDDQFWFLSRGSSGFPAMNYHVPIEYGVRQTFYVAAALAYKDSAKAGWVEISINEPLTGSSNSMPGQFVPRTSFILQDGETAPYLQIGLDTHDDGTPEEVRVQCMEWSLDELTF